MEDRALVWEGDMRAAEKGQDVQTRRAEVKTGRSPGRGPTAARDEEPRRAIRIAGRDPAAGHANDRT